MIEFLDSMIVDTNQLAELVEVAKQEGLEGADLNDAVYDSMSVLASDVNGCGMRDQLKILLVANGADWVRRFLKDETVMVEGL